jgi:hypothetical protein
VTTIVSGHGFDDGGEATFVPEGTTVRFYTRANVNLSKRIALLAQLDGAGDPGDQVQEGDDIRNYRLVAVEDEHIARAYAVDSASGIPIRWVGADLPSPIRLCEDVAGCWEVAGEHGHRCQGVLGRLHGEIVILACRGSAAPDPDTGDHHLATAYDEVNEEIRRTLDSYVGELMSGDPARVTWVEQTVDGMSEPTLALLGVSEWFPAWQAARWLKVYADQNDLKQLFGQLASNGDQIDAVLKWLDRIPAYGEAVDRVAEEYPTVFFQWMDQAPAWVEQRLAEAREAIAIVIEGRRFLPG